MSTDNITPTATGKKTATPQPPKSGWHQFLYDIWHALILILSLILIVWISYDTFENEPFLSNHNYMIFQLWVCLVFVIDFFLGLIFSKKKLSYLKNRWIFLLISIPYLNIISQLGLQISDSVLYYLRFIPLLRGTYAFAMVVGYISKNRAASMLSQYSSYLLAITYCGSLIFYYQEAPVNPAVKTFWDAIYWALMNVTTVGCYFSAVTVAGKVISVILPIAGMLILPMFTVYITALVKKYNSFTTQF